MTLPLCRGDQRPRPAFCHQDVVRPEFPGAFPVLAGQWASLLHAQGTSHMAGSNRQLVQLELQPDPTAALPKPTKLSYESLADLFEPVRHPHPRGLGALFLSNQHRGAVEALLHAIEQGRPVVVLTGAPGLGKTTLLQGALGRLRDAGTRVLHHDAAARTGELNELLGPMQSAARTVLAIDSAELLSPRVVHDLIERATTSAASAMKLHLVLAGRPDLLETLRQAPVDASATRAPMVRSLSPLTPDEAVQYVEHRVIQTGYPARQIITPGAVRIIAQGSEGVPAHVDRLLDLAVERATIEGEAWITSRFARAACAKASVRRSRSRQIALLAGGGIVAACALVGVWMSAQLDASDGTTAARIAQAAGPRRPSAEAPEPVVVAAAPTEAAARPTAETMPAEPDPPVSPRAQPAAALQPAPTMLAAEMAAASSPNVPGGREAAAAGLAASPTFPAGAGSDANAIAPGHRDGPTVRTDPAWSPPIAQPLPSDTGAQPAVRPHPVLRRRQDRPNLHLPIRRFGRPPAHRRQRRQRRHWPSRRRRPWTIRILSPRRRPPAPHRRRTGRRSSRRPRHPAARPCAMRLRPASPMWSSLPLRPPAHRPSRLRQAARKPRNRPSRRPQQRPCKAHPFRPRPIRPSPRSSPRRPSRPRPRPPRPSPPRPRPSRSRPPRPNHPRPRPSWPRPSLLRPSRLRPSRPPARKPFNRPPRRPRRWGRQARPPRPCLIWPLVPKPLPRPAHRASSRQQRVQRPRPCRRTVPRLSNRPPRHRNRRRSTARPSRPRPIRRAAPRPCRQWLHPSNLPFRPHPMRLPARRPPHL